MSTIEKQGTVSGGQKGAGEVVGQDPGSIRGGLVPAELGAVVVRAAAPRDFQEVLQGIWEEENRQEVAQPVNEENLVVQPEEAEEEDEEEEEEEEEDEEEEYDTEEEDDEDEGERDREDEGEEEENEEYEYEEYEEEEEEYGYEEEGENHMDRKEEEDEATEYKYENSDEKTQEAGDEEVESDENEPEGGLKVDVDLVEVSPGVPSWNA